MEVREQAIRELDTALESSRNTVATGGVTRASLSRNLTVVRVSSKAVETTVATSFRYRFGGRRRIMTGKLGFLALFMILNGAAFSIIYPLYILVCAAAVSLLLVTVRQITDGQSHWFFRWFEATQRPRLSTSIRWANDAGKGRLSSRELDRVSVMRSGGEFFLVSGRRIVRLSDNLSVLRRILAVVNWLPSPPAIVNEAVALANRAGFAGILASLANDAKPIAKAAVERRLALEIALDATIDAQQSADIAAEALTRWHDAEEIGQIADTLLIPEAVEEQFRALEAKKHSSEQQDD